MYGEKTSYKALFHSALIQNSKPLNGFQINSVVTHVPYFFNQQTPLICTSRNIEDIISSLLHQKGVNCSEDVALMAEGFLNDFFLSVQLWKGFEWAQQYNKGTQEYNVAFCFLYIKCVEFIQQWYKKMGYPVVDCCYERLVSSPKLVLSEICSLLNIEWDDHLLCHHILPHTETNSNDYAPGFTLSTRAIDQSSVGKDDLPQWARDIINQGELVFGQESLIWELKY